MERIVLIDDNHTTNFLNKMIIGRSAHPVPVEAFDQAQEALEFFRVNEASLMNTVIFLDINMPGMDGWQFARAFEKLGIDDSNYLIMLTSSVDPKDEEKARRIPVIRDYRSKPMTFEMINEVTGKFFKVTT